MYTIIGGDQKEYGPATADEIRQWIAEGRLNGQSLIKTENSADWLPLSSFTEFFAALHAQAAEAAPPTITPPAGSAPGLTETLPAPQIRIGHCLSRSWRLITAHFGVLFAATFLVWCISVVMQFLPLVGMIYWLIRGVLYGGLFLVFLRVIRGQPTSPSEAFSGFGPSFGQLMLVGIVASFLSWIGMFFCLLPGIYLSIAWAFSMPLVADKRLEFWSAMELSRKVVSRVWFQMFGLVFLAFLPVILMTGYMEVKITAAMWPAMQEIMQNSAAPDLPRLMQKINEVALEVAKTSLPLMLATKFVLLLNLPLALGALMFAYEDLFGPRPPRAD